MSFFLLVPEEACNPVWTARDAALLRLEPFQFSFFIPAQASRQLALTLTPGAEGGFLRGTGKAAFGVKQSKNVTALGDAGFRFAEAAGPQGAPQSHLSSFCFL